MKTPPDKLTYFQTYIKYFAVTALANVNYMEGIYFNGNEDLTKSLCAFRVVNLIFMFTFDMSFNDTDSLKGLRTIAILCGICYILIEIPFLTGYNFKNTFCLQAYYKFFKKTNNSSLSS